MKKNLNLNMTTKLKSKHVYLVCSGDLRLSANQKCWPEQAKMETALAEALKAEGRTVVRAHSYDQQKQHGFIDSQKMGIEVFRQLDPDAPLIVAEAVWQYSHHVLAGLTTHRGPILTVANWSGTWPGLVGMLNLNGSLTKAGIRYSSLWSENFTDGFFKTSLRQWLEEGAITHDQSHVRDFNLLKFPREDEELGRRFARSFRQQKAILGVFDEGCMGMYQRHHPGRTAARHGCVQGTPEPVRPLCGHAADRRRRGARRLDWLLKKGMTFHWGKDEETELTEAQTLQQCKMYIAAVRLADEFGCAAIGIQYQQGLKDLTPASDLAEGLLNNMDRPPVKAARSGRVLFAGEPVLTFQRSGRMRRAGRPGDIPPVARAGLRAGEHPARSPLGPALQGRGASMITSGCFSFPAPCRPRT